MILKTAIAVGVLNGVTLGQTLITKDQTYLQFGLVMALVAIVFTMGVTWADIRNMKQDVAVMKQELGDFLMQCAQDKNHPYKHRPGDKFQDMER